MKKLVLVLVIAATAAYAGPLDPLTEFGPAPAAPTKTSGGGLFGSGGLFGGSGLGGAAGSLGSAATGIPPLKFGVNTNVLTQDLKQAQSIKVQGGQGGAQAQIQANQQGSQQGTQTSSSQ